jgi:hypothetical protein
VGIADAEGMVITLANNHVMDTTNANQVNSFAHIREGDVDVLQIGSNELAKFDVIVSNSFIEHLTCWEDQCLVAKRIIESGRPYFIQTPNKASPINPHFPRPYVPFFAVYPRHMQARLLTLGELGGRMARPVNGGRALGTEVLQSSRRRRHAPPVPGRRVEDRATDGHADVHSCDRATDPARPLVISAAQETRASRPRVAPLCDGRKADGCAQGLTKRDPQKA